MKSRAAPYRGGTGEALLRRAEDEPWSDMAERDARLLANGPRLGPGRRYLPNKHATPMGS